MANNVRGAAWSYLVRLIIAIFIVFFVVIFLIWRIDNPRIESLRFRIMDSLPEIETIYRPFTSFGNVITSFQNYEALANENKELRRRLRLMETWREAALQLEQTNAELRALNNLKFATKQSYISGEITADTGGNFAQTVLINVGNDKGVTVGSAAIDGFGLVGRVIGVGETSSRILLLSDSQSQIAAKIMPDRLNAIVRGNNTLDLDLVLIDSGERILAGARVVTSGDGVLPPDLPIGYITIDANEQVKVKLAADYSALEFARILLRPQQPEISTDSEIVGGRQSFGLIPLLEDGVSASIGAQNE